jgi:hypothetical protein
MDSSILLVLRKLAVKKFKPVRFVLSISVALFLGCLSGCSTAPEMVTHEFSFGNYKENPRIEILDYQYGSSKRAGTYADKNSLASGHIPQSWGIYGTIPRGDFLYVKWRDESTGKVYEDTVDLKRRLPANITNQDIHFSIKGSQLYVYLISTQQHDASRADCPVHASRQFKCAMVYPEYKSNY